MIKFFVSVSFILALALSVLAAEVPAPSLAELEAKYAVAQAQLREEFANLRAAQAEIGRIREMAPRLESEAQALKAQIDAARKKQGDKK